MENKKSKYKEEFDSVKAGVIIGHWKILDNYLIVKNKKLAVKCLCTNCNMTISYVRPDNLLSGKTTKCKVCSTKTKSTYKGIIGSVFNKIKKGANKRNIEFNISIEEIGDLFEEQKGLCALSGLTLKLKEYYLDNTSTASLDRISSKKGYLKDNIQWVHKDINFMKGSLSEEYFIELCTLISSKNKK